MEFQIDSSELSDCDVILVLLEYAYEWGQSQTDAQSLFQQMRTKKFIFLLLLFKELFNKSDFATKGLQSINVSVTQWIWLKILNNPVTAVIVKMLAMTSKIMGDNTSDSWDMSVPSCSQKLPSWFEESIVTASLGKSTRVRSDNELWAIYYIILLLNDILNELIDCQLNELSARFHNDSYGLVKSETTLLASSCDTSLTGMTESEWCMKAFPYQCDGVGAFSVSQARHKEECNRTNF